MRIIKLALWILLLLLVRKLVWCIRWLWCYRHGREVPEPISFIAETGAVNDSAASNTAAPRTRIFCNRISDSFLYFIVIKRHNKPLIILS